MKAEFVDALLGFIRTQATTTGEVVVSQGKNWPILDVMVLHARNFARESFPNLRLRKRTADQSSDLQISPKSHRQGKIIRGPAPESHARCF